MKFNHPKSLIKRTVSDWLVILAIIIGALALVIGAVSGVAAWKATGINHQQGVANHQVEITTQKAVNKYLTEQNDLIIVANEQVAFYNVICINLHELNPTGPACPALKLIPNTNSKQNVPKK